ncbi:MAG TPA: tripartite tricarboxylate transporter substrate binding protein [Burkholderiales bacterium]|nr:tripartite tricarboxylate transporter substrate binding protein [Burkholderiales bacterium]
MQRALRNLVVAAAAGLLTHSPAALAQSYPAKPIRIIHGFAPGSAIDVFSRPLAQKLGEVLGQSVVVDARPGATGTIANEFVSKAPPDGYTLLAAPGSAMASTPHVYAIRYKPLEFTPIVQISDFSYVLIVHPSVPFRSARELIALAKAKPGVLTFGSTGVGSGFHLAGELFASMAGIKLLHVPYRGGGTAAVVDVVAGRVDMMWDSLGVVRPYVQAGRLRLIGVTGARRAAALPDAPTLAESGLPGYQITGWHGILGPPGLPREIVTTLNTTIAKILGTSDMRELWSTLAMEIVPNTPEQFAERLRLDYEKYGKLIKSIGLKPQS